MDNKYSPKKKPNSFSFQNMSKDSLLPVSLALNLVLVLLVMYFAGPRITGNSTSMLIKGEERTWHGGHPMAKDHKGSCWCGAEDQYCMCTPNVAIDLILVDKDSTTPENQFVWLVRRKDTSQLATMGGFVDVGETVEQAVHRELKEEMGVALEGSSKGSHELLQLQGVYSDPKRDNRRRNVSIVFVVFLQHEISPKAADDVKEVTKLNLDDIENQDFFADHKTILLDYRQSLKGGGPATSRTLIGSMKHDMNAKAALYIERSVCTNEKKKAEFQSNA